MSFSVLSSSLFLIFRKLHIQKNQFIHFMLLYSLLPPSPSSPLTPPLLFFFQRHINAQSTLFSFCFASLYNLLGVDDMESLLSPPGTCKSWPDTRENESGLKDEDLRKSLMGTCRVIVSFAAKPMSAIVPGRRDGRLLHAARACFRSIIYSWFSFHAAAVDPSTDQTSAHLWEETLLCSSMCTLRPEEFNNLDLCKSSVLCLASATLESVRSSALDHLKSSHKTAEREVFWLNSPLCF